MLTNLEELNAKFSIEEEEDRITLSIRVDLDSASGLLIEYIKARLKTYDAEKPIVVTTQRVRACEASSGLFYFVLGRWKKAQQTVTCLLPSKDDLQGVRTKLEKLEFASVFNLDCFSLLEPASS